MTERKGASMTEPVAWMKEIRGSSGPEMPDECEVQFAPYRGTLLDAAGWTRLYTHPAPAPAGVPDWCRLYEEVRKLTDGGSESLTHEDAVKQIMYWQSQFVERGDWLSPETVREYYLPLPELVGYENTIAQQAERIAELTAKLAEAVGLLEEALPSIETVASSFENPQDKWHAAFVHRIKAVIDAAIAVALERS